MLEVNQTALNQSFPAGWRELRTPQPGPLTCAPQDAANLLAAVIRLPHDKELLEDAAPGLSTREFCRTVAPFIAPYYARVLRVFALQPSEALSEIGSNAKQAGTLRKLLRAPVNQRDANGGPNNIARDEGLLHARAYLRDHVMRICRESRPKEISIGLAGTLSKEVHDAYYLAGDALYAQARRLCVPQQEMSRWFSEWKVSILALSISPISYCRYLADSGRYNFTFPSWIKFHYMNLLDPFQTAALPTRGFDLLFCKNSLYSLGFKFYAEAKRVLRPGGLYVTEQKIRPSYCASISNAIFRAARSCGISEVQVSKRLRDRGWLAADSRIGSRPLKDFKDAFSLELEVAPGIKKELQTALYQTRGAGLWKIPGMVRLPSLIKSYRKAPRRASSGVYFKGTYEELPKELRDLVEGKTIAPSALDSPKYVTDLLFQNHPQIMPLFFDQTARKRS